MTKEGSYKIVNFMTPGEGALVLGRGHVRQIVKMHYFFNKRPTALNGHLSIRDFTLTYCQIAYPLYDLYGQPLAQDPCSGGS